MSIKWIIVTALSFLCALELQARPDRPFTPDSTTAGLWSFDRQYPELAEEQVLQGETPAWFRKAIPSQDGNYIVLGEQALGEDRVAVTLTKLRQDGELIWTQSYYGGLSWECNSLVETARGEIWIVGTLRVDAEAQYVLSLFRIDSEGDSITTQTFPSPFFDAASFGAAILSCSDGTIAVGGTVMLDMFGVDGWDMFIIKLSQDGEVVWDEHYHREGDELSGIGVEHLAETSDGGLICIGQCDTWPDAWAYSTPFAMWLDANGARQRERRYEFDERPTWINDLDITRNGFLLVGGSQHAWDGFWDGWDSKVWVFEIDLEGDILWSGDYGLELGATFYIGEGWSATTSPNSGMILIATDVTLMDTVTVGGEIEFTYHDHVSSILTLDSRGDSLDYYELPAQTDQYVFSIQPSPEETFAMFGSKVRGDNDESGDPYFATTTSVISPGTDHSGQGNVLITPEGSRFVDGLFGEALINNLGSGRPVYATDSHSLRPTQYRIEGWLKPAADMPPLAVPFSKVLLPDMSSFAVVVDNEQELLGLSILTTDGPFEVFCNAVLADDEWHYIAATVTDDTLSISWDDEEPVHSRYSGEMIYDEGDLLFGSARLEADTMNAYRGLIDEFRFTGLSYEPPNSVPPFLSLIPQHLSLSSFPNPFNSSTTITYSLPRPGRYALSVVDITGREVARLSEGWREAGSYREVWNAGAAQGMYFAIIEGTSFCRTTPLLLLK